VASIAESQGVKGKAAKAPISTHPAFPFIVALWFAALLGMGSLVVPVEVIERLTVATGIASLVPATAPPLGFTARALIALVFTGAGAIAGLLIARQVAKAHQPDVSRRYPPTMQHGPIQAHAELGAHGLDGHRAPIQPKGRRSLAIELDHGPSDLLDFAPLPGKRVEAGNSALEMLDPNAREQVSNAWLQDEFADDELELTEDDLAPGGDFASVLHVSPVPASAPSTAVATPGFQTFADESGDAMMHDMMGNRPPFGLQVDNAIPADSAAPRQIFGATPAAVAAPVHDEESGDEPLSFSPPSLARFDVAEPAAPSDAADEPGLVQLAQRLGNSIERRRERLAARAAQAAAVVAAAPLGEDIEVAAPNEAAAAMAAYFSNPSTPETAEIEAAEIEAAQIAAPVPVAYEPAADGRQMFQPVAEEAPAQPKVAYGNLSGLSSVNFDDDDEDSDDAIHDLAASFSLPLSNQPVAPAAAAAAVADELEDEPDFASLLALRNPFHEQKPQVFVRIEDEPEMDDAIGETAVVFPSEMAPRPVAAPAAAPAPFAPAPSTAPSMAASIPANSAENERALREALLSLQRMSGTA
jgi:hypothetical protein